MIDPHALRILIAVHDTGSVRGAADLLGFTSPNITQHVRRLERRLGEPMVERAGRGIVLTPRALALVERARPLIDALEQVDLPLRAEEIGGVVRVAAFPTALRGLVLPTIAALRGEHPGLEVVPVESDPPSAVDGLGAGRLDAVVTKSWGATTPSATARRLLARIDLGRDPLDAILPTGHRLAARDAVGLGELAGERWAITPPDDPFGTWVSAHSPALVDDLLHAYTALEFQSLIRFAELGLAVTVAPRLGRGPLPPRVVAVPLADPDAYRAVHLHVRPMAQDAATTRLLVRHFRSLLGGEPDAGATAAPGR